MALVGSMESSEKDVGISEAKNTRRKAPRKRPKSAVRSYRRMRTDGPGQVVARGPIETNLCKRTKWRYAEGDEKGKGGSLKWARNGWSSR